MICNDFRMAGQDGIETRQHPVAARQKRGSVCRWNAGKIATKNGKYPDIERQASPVTTSRQLHVPTTKLYRY